jgi:hypothetical protein
MASPYQLKILGYALVDAALRQRQCWGVINLNIQGDGRIVWPTAEDGDLCATKAAAQAKLQELNGV